MTAFKRRVRGTPRQVGKVFPLKKADKSALSKKLVIVKKSEVKKEMKEHPWASRKQAEKIAADHAKKEVKVKLHAGIQKDTGSPRKDTFKCNICKADGFNVRELVAHLEKKHKIPFNDQNVKGWDKSHDGFYEFDGKIVGRRAICNICGKVFPRVTDIPLHIKTAHKINLEDQVISGWTYDTEHLFKLRHDENYRKWNEEHRKIAPLYNKWMDISRDFEDVSNKLEWLISLRAIKDSTLKRNEERWHEFLGIIPNNKLKKSKLNKRTLERSIETFRKRFDVLYKKFNVAYKKHRRAEDKILAKGYFKKRADLI